MRFKPCKLTINNRPLYFLGLTFQIPATPQTQYLTLALKGLGFGTFNSNLLTIPYTVIHSTLAMTIISEKID
jgi:hypothetical protein